MKAGSALKTCGGKRKTIVLMPPLCIQDEDVEFLGRAFRKSLAELEI